jgi:hypothetical protein
MADCNNNLSAKDPREKYIPRESGESQKKYDSRMAELKSGSMYERQGKPAEEHLRMVLDRVRQSRGNSQGGR